MDNADQQKISDRALKLLAPDPDIDYVEWSDQNFYLSREAASEHGKYRTSRTPFVREPLRELSPTSETEVVVVIKPTQCAGTTIALIFLCGIADIAPGPTLFMQPTDSMAKSFSKKKLSTCIKAIPRLTGKIKEPRSRDSGNTILQKDFPGGSWMLTGSNSGASYRQESIKYLILDDFDAFEMDIEGEGDPQELADRRTGTFAGRKIYINSTTTLKDTSNIMRAYKASSQGQFNVPCPHCNQLQYLEWGGKDVEWGVKYKVDDDYQVIEAWYVCKHCLKRIEETAKTWMLENGFYVHKYPNRKVKGFKWNALHTPIGWVNSWAYIAQKFLEAAAMLKQGSAEKYKVWLNSFMSEPFEESGEQPSWALLKAKCEPYRELIIPPGVRMLSAGVDVHATRLDVTLFGWGTGEECWVIYHNSIIGDVQFQDPWDQLDGLLLHRTFDMHNGGNMTCLSIGVDAGDGNTTQAVRNYCRYRSPRVFALKGASTMGKPIVSPPTLQDLTWQGEKIENGVEMWTIGTDTAKSTLYSRFKIDTAGPGRIHFYIGLDDEYFQQLTAEKVITRFVKGYPVREWHNIRGNKANHALDTMVYGYAAAIRAGLPFMAPDVPGRTVVHKKPRPVRPKSDNRKGRFW